MAADGSNLARLTESRQPPTSRVRPGLERTPGEPDQTCDA
jgi:hypothetical protein